MEPDMYKSRRRTAFPPQTNIQFEVVNKTLLQLLKGYNIKHGNIWDESILYL